MVRRISSNNVADRGHALLDKGKIIAQRILHIVNRQICLFISLISYYQANLPYNQWLAEDDR